MDLDTRPPDDPFDFLPPDEPAGDPFSGPEPEEPPLDARAVGDAALQGRVVPFEARKPSALDTIGPAFEPPDVGPRDAPPYPEPVFEEPGATTVEPERALELRRETLIERANAMQVSDDASYRVACDYLLTLKGWLNDADAHFDPRVADAHKVWKRLCDDRSEFKAPLQLVLGGLSRRADVWKRADDDRRFREAQERQAELDRLAEAERARIKAEADAAAAKGDTDRAQDLFTEAKRTVAPVVEPERATKVRGVAHKEKWVAEVVDVEKLVHAVAGLDQVLDAIRFRIDDLSKAKAPVGYEFAIGELRSLQVFILQLKPNMPLDALQPNNVYLGGRARSDKGSITEEWEKYGVRVRDAGTTAITPSAARG